MTRTVARIAAPLAALLLLGATAHAAPIRLGGVDAQSQYTGYSGGSTDAGVYTFNDTVNGTNPGAEPGSVTSTDVPAAIPTNGLVDLELQLDTTGFDPATDSLTGASFTGTGAGPEIQIWDASQSTVLLAVDVDFVDVTSAFPLHPFVNPNGPSTFTLGNPNLSQLGTNSRITVVGGTQAGAVGGVGSEGVLEVFLSGPVPALDGNNLAGYLNDDFEVIDQDAPSNAVTWDMTFVPEPGTALLLGSGLFGLGLRRRRRQG